MKAIYYQQHGDVDVLQYGELPTPEPNADQVLVKIAAAAVILSIADCALVNYRSILAVRFLSSRGGTFPEPSSKSDRM